MKSTPFVRILVLKRPCSARLLELVNVQIPNRSMSDLRIIPNGEVPFREWCLESVACADTLLCRDKSMRLIQYTMRMLTGLNPSWTQGTPGNLMRTLAVARKSLRFWRPLRSWRSIDEVLKAKLGSDLALTEFDRTLTLIEHLSFAVYCLIDHLAFFQRVGGLSKLTADQADALDRVAEFNWTIESIVVVWREMRSLGRIRKELALGNLAIEHVLKERKKKALLSLFKAGVCDIPCSLYFWAMNAKTRNQGKHKAWCGFLGILASCVSLYGMWPRKQQVMYLASPPSLKMQGRDPTGVDLEVELQRREKHADKA